MKTGSGRAACWARFRRRGTGTSVHFALCAAGQTSQSPSAIFGRAFRGEGGTTLSKNSFKLKDDLFDRVKKCAEVAGYSSPQEFVEHVLEKELAKIEDAESDEAIMDKLKGLGYLE